MRPETNYSEAEIIEGIQENDRKVLECLYKEMVPVIYRDVIKNSGTEEDAKDHFQEIMLVVIQNVKANKYESGNIKGYIRRVAQNLWHKKLRKEGHLGLSGIDHEQEEDEMNYEKYMQLLKYDEKIAMVEQKLQEMNNPCRDVLISHYYHKTPLKAIAERYQWSYAYCKKKIYQCRQAMKNLLKQKKIFQPKLCS